MSIILIDKGGQCLCDFATKCIRGKTGSATRCTKEQIESLGYKTKNLEQVLKTDHWKLGYKERTMNALKIIFKYCRKYG